MKSGASRSLGSYGMIVEKANIPFAYILEASDDIV